MSRCEQEWQLVSPENIPPRLVWEVLSIEERTGEIRTTEIADLEERIGWLYCVTVRGRNGRTRTCAMQFVPNTRHRCYR
jgi:hypothetical protein